MAAPTSPLDLNTTASSNGPDGATEQVSVLDDYIRGLSASVKHLVVKGTDIVSAATITPAATASFFDITGTTGITAIGSTNSWDGRIVWFQFDGALTITHASTLKLPGAVNYTTAAGDVLAFVQETSGTWRCVQALRAGNTKPSFRAYRSSNQTSGTTVIFDTETHDHASNYNNSTGVFTAPVAGVYLFCSSVTLYNNTGSSALGNTYLAVNGTASTYSFRSIVDNGETYTSHISVVVYLAASDQVRIDTVTTMSGTYLASLLGTEFSGHLLS